MAVQHSPNDIYERFIEFEDKAADIYLRFASRFSSENRELSAFWLEMAMEEKQHAVLLRFCQAEKWFAPNLPTRNEIREFAVLFRNLEKLAGKRDLSGSDAFAIAAELEGSEVNAIYGHLTTPLHASPYLLKKKMAASPFDHGTHLIAAAKKFGVPAAAFKGLDRLKVS